MDKENWISKIQEHEAHHTSQGMQDGVIDFICQNIDISNNYCIEFGFDSTNWDDCLPNTGHLVHQRKWDYLLLDGNCDNPDINLYQHFITSENICQLFEKYGVPKEPGYISIDLDSTDIWVTAALLKNYQPSFISVEFNPNFPIDAAMAFPNDKDEFWLKDRVMGSSLKALSMMAQNHGYSLVYAGCFSSAKHSDAFFVRDDLSDKSHVPTLESFADTYVPLHGVCLNGRENIYLNYAVWIETKDVQKSRDAVPKEWKKYISGTFTQRLTRKRKMLTHKFFTRLSIKRKRLMHKLGFAQ